MLIRGEYIVSTNDLDIEILEPLVFSFIDPQAFTVDVSQWIDSSSPNVIVRFEGVADPRIAELLEEWRAHRWPQQKDDHDLLADFFDKYRALSWSRAARVIQTLRWRCGVVGPLHPASTYGTFCSVDGTEWHPFPPEKPGAATIRVVLQRDASIIVREVVELATQEVRWPIGYEMLAEALGHHFSPRSAIVIGVGALEVAVKEFISFHVPKAAWLTANSPSPPITKIIKEYLPTLIKRHPCPPRSTLSILHKAIELRNKIAHRGEETPDREEASAILDAVKDTIWLLEYCKGFDRAWEFISPGIQREYLVEFHEILIDQIFSLDDRARKRLKGALPSIITKDEKTEKTLSLFDELKEKIPQGFIRSLCKFAVEPVQSFLAQRLQEQK